jgi:Uma2 family endonuclease
MGNLAYQEEIYDELLNGKVVAMSPRPVVNHQIVEKNIVNIFENFLKGKTCNVFHELDVYLTDKDRVIPDVMVVCSPDIIKRNGIHGAPDLIIEILSLSTAKRDRGYKKRLYERCGVREYWLVNTDERSIEVYRLENGEYDLDDVYMLFYPSVVEEMDEEEKAFVKYEVRTSLFPEFEIPLEQVFGGMFL